MILVRTSQQTYEIKAENLSRTVVTFVWVTFHDRKQFKYNFSISGSIKVQTFCASHAINVKTFCACHAVNFKRFCVFHARTDLMFIEPQFSLM